MKNKFILAVMIGGSFFANSCSSDDSGSSTDDTALEVSNTVTSGTWHITSYIDSGNDETSDFSGYNFTFSGNSVLTASNGTNTYTGNWIVTDSDSDDDNPSGDIDFNIIFLEPASFSDLTDDWDVQSRTATKIELIDVSGGNGGTDYLTFEKN